MDVKSKNVCRYLVGLIFAFSFLQQIVSWDSLTFWNVFPLIGALLMAVSMFTGVYELLAVGAGVQALLCLINLVRALGRFSVYSLYQLSFLAGYVLIIYFVFKRHSAVKISILAAVLFLAGQFFAYFSVIGSDNSLPIMVNALRNTFCNSCLPTVLAGLILSNTQKVRPVRAVPTAKKPETSNSQIENLVKLKELLDAGAITQEEFDAKKKQLLGL